MDNKKRLLLYSSICVMGLAIGFFGFKAVLAHMHPTEYRTHGAVHYASCLVRVQQHIGDAFHADERAARSKALPSESAMPRRWKWAVGGKGQYHGKATGFYCESWEDSSTGDFHIEGLVLGKKILEGSPTFRMVAAGFLALREDA